MKLADIKVGTQYAVGSNHWFVHRCTVLGFEKIDAKKYSWSKPRMMTHVRVKRHNLNRDAADGIETLVPSRDLRETWKAHAEKERKKKEKQDAERYSWRQAHDVVELLRSLGYGPAMTHGSRVSLHYEDFQRLLKDLKPREESAEEVCTCRGCDYCRGRHRGLITCRRPAEVDRCEGCKGA